MAQHAANVLMLDEDQPPPGLQASGHACLPMPMPMPMHGKKKAREERKLD
jgi:hypothetical protein